MRQPLLAWLLLATFLAGTGTAPIRGSEGTADAREPLRTASRTLRLAIEDLMETFESSYPQGPAFLSRLEKLAGDVESAAATETEALGRSLDALRRDALIANPLVSGRPILYVVRRQYRSHYHAIDTLFHTGELNVDRGFPHCDLFDGGGALKVLDLGADGTTRTLVESATGVVRDPDVHFDGDRIVFAMRRSAAEDYHIWEVEADGTGLRQLTSATGVSDFDPVYLPDDSIVFSSTREPKYNMCSRDHGANLFRMEPDGANIHQITKNTLFDNHSCLLEDGRILYARWEYVDRNFGDAHGLWTVHPDGTEQAIYWGNNTAVPGAVFNAHPIPGSHKILCVLGPHHDRLWGALAIIDRAAGLDGKPPVIRTWPSDAIDAVRSGGAFDCDLHARTVRIKYEDPWPLSDKYFLCSRMTGDGERTGFYLVDVFGNEILLHAEDPGCFDPMPLRPRPRPPFIPSRRDFESQEGFFYILDVYHGTHMQGVARGSVKYLRVVESPEKRHWSRGRWVGQGYTAPAMNWHSLENKRILGTVPVARDGSAYFAVPADAFVYFQLLDEDGMMVQSMRSGTVVQPGEVSGCHGCHEDRLSAPPPGLAGASLAFREAPQRLTGWYGPPRSFGFMQEVQPVLTKHCAPCHDYGKDAGDKLNLAPDRTLTFNTAYQELWRKGLVTCVGGGPAEIQAAYSWGSHSSSLIREIRDPRVPAHRDLRLSREETDRLVTWVDLNAVYYPTYASAYPDSLNGRCPLDDSQIHRLGRLTGVRFPDLMTFGSNPGPLVSFERPELSPCLSHLKTEDPSAYLEALRIIETGRDALAKNPRADMPGFKPNPIDQAREERYVARGEIELRNREAIRSGARLYDASHPPTPDVPSPQSPRFTVPEPPTDFPLPLREAHLADARGTRFVWRTDCGNDLAGDHDVYGGWEDPADTRNYLAWGEARVHGRWRTGLIALACPDGNVLRATWPVEAEAGTTLRITTGLTDQAARETRSGATVRVLVARDDGERTLLSAELEPGDGRLVEAAWTFAEGETGLTLEVDNRGSEFWSVVYLDVSRS